MAGNPTVPLGQGVECDPSQGMAPGQCGGLWMRWRLCPQFVLESKAKLVRCTLAACLSALSPLSTPSPGPPPCPSGRIRGKRGKIRRLGKYKEAVFPASGWEGKERNKKKREEKREEKEQRT